MDNFDPTALPYTGNPLDLSNVGTGNFANLLPTIGLQDNMGLYDTGDFGK